MNLFNKSNNGFSLIELLVAVAIFGILAAGVFRVVTNSYSNFYGTGDRQTVTEFAKEGMEAVRAIRDASWQYIENQAEDTDTGIVRDASGNWSFSGSSDTLGELTRTIQLSSVARDSAGNIVDSGGTVDPRTKKVTVTVSGIGIQDYVLDGYIVNWSSKAWLQTDWSGYGLANFWASTTMASSFTAIATSTVGQATLTAYSFTSSKIITIDSDQVSGTSNHTNFPLYFSATLDSLRSTGNGGDVTNANGYDIIFTSDAAGTTILDHEIEYYNPATGQFDAWVRIPILDYNDDTNIYMFYGNGDISTSQEDVGGVWDSNFVAVLHMAEDPSVNTDGDCSGSGYLCDSTTNDNDAESFGTMTTGDLIDGPAGKALDMDGSNDRLVISDSSSLDGATGAGQARTISMWIRIDTGVDNELITDKSNFNGYHFWLQTQGTGGDVIGGVTTTGSYVDLTNPLGTGNAKYLTMTYDGATTNIYVNGFLEDYGTQTAADDDNNDLYIFGTPSGYAIDGLLDEFRISDVDRSKEWIETEFNNMNSTSTFYYIGTNSGFAYNRSIVVDNTQVSGSQNLSNFPVFVTTTVDDLRTVSNGGLVTDDNGYDIVFSSDAAGSTILDHEIEYYSSSTGAIAMWVRVPTLSYSSDTTIYLQYGSSTIITSQENINGVWDSNYTMVYHMGEDPSTYSDGYCAGPGLYYVICDSTSNGNHSYAGGTMTTSDRISGPAGYAIDFDGTDDYLVTPDVTISESTGAGQARTWSFWLNITTGADNRIITEKSNFDGDHYWLQTQGTSGDIIGGVSAAGSYLDSDPVVGIGTWKYITVIYDGTDESLYVNGALNDGPVTVTAPADNANAFIIAGAYPGTFLDASFDELRLSKVARSTDWLTTEYNNMSAPSTFYTINAPTDNVGSGIVLSAYNTPGTIISSTYDMGSTDKNLNTITIEQNIPSGCNLQVTLKADDSSDFSSAVSQVFSSSTVSLYTSTVTSTMDGYRWLRYEASLTACNSNSQTPTLYSINIDYR